MSLSTLLREMGQLAGGGDERGDKEKSHLPSITGQGDLSEYCPRKGRLEHVLSFEEQAATNASSATDRTEQYCFQLSEKSSNSDSLKISAAKNTLGL